MRSRPHRNDEAAISSLFCAACALSSRIMLPVNQTRIKHGARNENFFPSFQLVRSCSSFDPFSIFIILWTTFRFSHECEKFPISLVDFFPWRAWVPSHSAIVESGRGRPFRGVQGSLTSRAARASTCPYYFRLPRKIRVRVRTKTLVQNKNNVSKMLEIRIIMKSLRTRGRRCACKQNTTSV